MEILDDHIPSPSDVRTMRRSSPLTPGFFFLTITFFCLFSASSAETTESSYEAMSASVPGLQVEDHDNSHPAEIRLVAWRFDEISIFVTIPLFFLAATLAKIAYHNLEILHCHVPESCVLILLGTAVGLLCHALDYKERLSFRSDRFMFLLLPPIILESAYSLHDKAFFHNFKAILLYAVVGTVINVALIGGSLYGLERLGTFGTEISLIECFTFASIVAAVDPVAVLAILHEVGVNKSLYFLVFGESLLNDAVAIVLYGMMTTFAAMPVVTVKDAYIGFLSFFTISGGGLILGILTGAVTAMITRSTKNVRVVEPLVVFILAYLSYIMAELFHFSGIISLIACGLVQYQYVADNISVESLTTIKYFVKTMSSISDVIIFFYLGRVLVRDDHTWCWAFIGFSTLFCVVYRFFSTFFLTAFANRFLQGIKRISLGEQLIMAYAGLRGPIAFSLALTLDSQFIPNSQLFVTTSLFIILFTVFFLGITTKPMIKLLDVKLKNEVEDASMLLEINERVFDTILSGIEEIADVTAPHSWTMKFHRINDNYFKRYLTRGDMHSFNHTYEAVKGKKVRRSTITDPGITIEAPISFRKASSLATVVDSVFEEELNANSALNRKERRRSTVRSGKKEVAIMFQHSQYYHLPQRDSIVSPRTPTPTETLSPPKELTFCFPGRKISKQSSRNDQE